MINDGKMYVLMQVEHVDDEGQGTIKFTDTYPITDHNILSVWVPPIGATLNNYPNHGDNCVVVDVIYEMGEIEHTPIFDDKHIAIAVVMQLQ